MADQGEITAEARAEAQVPTEQPVTDDPLNAAAQVPNQQPIANNPLVVPGLADETAPLIPEPIINTNVNAGPPASSATPPPWDEGTGSLRYRDNPWAYSTNSGSILTRDDLDAGWKSAPVRLLVGPDEVELFVPESWLCKIDFFKAALTGGFKEANTRTVHLPDDDPDAIKSFLAWLLRGFDEWSYTEQWVTITGQGWVVDLIPLANKWFLPQLAEQCCELIFNRCMEDLVGVVNVENILRCYRSLVDHRTRFLPVHVVVVAAAEADDVMEIEMALLGEGMDAEFWADYGRYKVVQHVVTNFGKEEEEDGEFEKEVQRQCLVQAVVSNELDLVQVPMKQFEAEGLEKEDLISGEWIRRQLGL